MRRSSCIFKCYTHTGAHIHTQKLLKDLDKVATGQSVTVGWLVT